MSASKTKACALLGLLALGLGGCETPTPNVMGTWLDSTDAHLMAEWGVPDRESTAGGGFRVLTYVEETDLSDGRRLVCHRTFTVDADHRIVAANSRCS